MGTAYRNARRMGMQPLRGTIVYPANGDLVKALAADHPAASPVERPRSSPACRSSCAEHGARARKDSSFEGERCALATGTG